MGCDMDLDVYAPRHNVWSHSLADIGGLSSRGGNYSFLKSPSVKGWYVLVLLIGPVVLIYIFAGLYYRYAQLYPLLLQEAFSCNKLPAKG